MRFCPVRGRSILYTTSAGYYLHHNIKWNHLLDLLVIQGHFHSKAPSHRSTDATRHSFIVCSDVPMEIPRSPESGIACGSLRKRDKAKKIHFYRPRTSAGPCRSQLERKKPRKKKRSGPSQACSSFESLHLSAPANRLGLVTHFPFPIRPQRFTFLLPGCRSFRFMESLLMHKLFSRAFCRPIMYQKHLVLF